MPIKPYRSSVGTGNIRPRTRRVTATLSNKHLSQWTAERQTRWRTEMARPRRKLGENSMKKWREGHNARPKKIMSNWWNISKNTTGDKWREIKKIQLKNKRWKTKYKRKNKYGLNTASTKYRKRKSKKQNDEA